LESKIAAARNDKAAFEGGKSIEKLYRGKAPSAQKAIVGAVALVVQVMSVVPLSGSRAGERSMVFTVEQQMPVF